MTTCAQQPTTRRSTGWHITTPLRALVAAGMLALALSGAATVTPSDRGQALSLPLAAVQQAREAAFFLEATFFLKIDGVDGESRD